MAAIGGSPSATFGEDFAVCLRGLGVNTAKSRNPVVYLNEYISTYLFLMLALFVQYMLIYYFHLFMLDIQRSPPYCTWLVAYFLNTYILFSVTRSKINKRILLRAADMGGFNIPLAHIQSYLSACGRPRKSALSPGSRAQGRSTRIPRPPRSHLTAVRVTLYMRSLLTAWGNSPLACISARSSSIATAPTGGDGIISNLPDIVVLSSIVSLLGSFHVPIK